MENRDGRAPETISYFIHEGEMVRVERYHKRIVTILTLVIVAMLIWAGAETVLRHMENNAWLAYLSEYDFTDYQYSQDGSGLNIIGDGNGVDYSGAKIESADSDEEESVIG